MKPKYVSLKESPSPKTEYVQEFTNLFGGLNLRDADYRLKANESPEIKNLLWKDGMLRSRKGQRWLSSSELGTGHAAFEKPWHGYIFCHIGTKLYCFDSQTGTYTELCSGVPEVRGTFFLYGNKLYYKTRGAYKVISAEYTNDAWSFTAANVIPYIPVVLINADPTSASGDLYQPENRLQSRKIVWYNASAGIKQYHLPVKATTVTRVEVDGVSLSTGWAYNTQTGIVTFNTAPPVTDPPTNNTVRITYLLENPEAYQSIDDCRYCTVYGGTGELCVVMAGSTEQPNAYFWSGNSNIKMDASYFPMEQYQLASSTEERITGFGKQQDNLIIFKESSVGKTTLGTAVLNDRVYIDMPYVPINASIGCNLPWSIRLVENNLVFANSTGVYMLLDTTAANENNILCLSRKLGDNARFGFSASARENTSSVAPGNLSEQIGGGLSSAGEDEVCSCDDGKRYYLTGNGETYCWDYNISSYKDPSWFYLTNTNAIAYIAGQRDGSSVLTETARTVPAVLLLHLDALGRLTVLQEEFNDYGSPIERIYRFPMSSFGGYDRRKNINSVIVTLGAFERENTELIYITDYETHADLTNPEVVPDLEYEASRVVGTRPQSAVVPAVFRRRPMCRRVLHFTMKLRNNNINEDLELVGVQVFWNMQGRLR